ncbi:histidine phosphatase family protein [Patescibacteria group bacterium]|nr:histidine phosphatase family protein [Patescibacteria group bacterium]MCG2702312.1 histidine phosphatase family protein [Candidatus Parcubacteria bacterium]MBU4264591.1 histidine phosphatase family protein [Patescibacteria group bacterium]MBU4390259.1 histidine phosphatase family protein [Patescibacteria group bacterium]MBU4397329.1 histidine phosphatase family protein [Patescibacteria group bacterium]
MKIYLIRHGQTIGDVEDRYGGAYDDELSDKGKIQAHELANRLGNSGIQILFCSPMTRAQQTAKILKTKLSCEIKTIKDLRERNKNGILTGMTRDEAKIKYPKLVEELKDYRSQIQGAESQEDFAKRIKKAFMEITGVSNYSTIAIVTHGMPFWVIFGDILNDNRIINIADCAYAVLNKEDHKFTLDRSDGIDYKKEK